MPRKGKAYDIDDLWRDAVEAELVDTQTGKVKMTREQLADRAGCPKSLITELLDRNPDTQRHQTTYLPEIHEALGWPPPLGPLLPADERFALSLWRLLDENGRRKLLEDALKRLDELKAAPKRR